MAIVSEVATRVLTIGAVVVIVGGGAYYLISNTALGQITGTAGAMYAKYFDFQMSFVETMFSKDIASKKEWKKVGKKLKNVFKK